MACPTLCGRKHVIEQRCTEFIACDLSNMFYAKFLCHMGGALVVTKQNYFTLRPQESPTSDRVSLDNACMSRKRFGNRKQKSASIRSPSMNLNPPRSIDQRVAPIPAKSLATPNSEFVI